MDSHRYEQQCLPVEVPLAAWRGAGSEIPRAPGAEQAGAEARTAGMRGAGSSPIRGVRPTRDPSVGWRQFCEKPLEFAGSVAGLLSSPFIASDLEKAQGRETCTKLGKFLLAVRGEAEASRHDALLREPLHLHFVLAAGGDVAAREIPSGLVQNRLIQSEGAHKLPFPSINAPRDAPATAGLLSFCPS